MSKDQTQESEPLDPAMGLVEKPAAVLLVDDDPKNLLALQSVLDEENYTLVKARTGDEALLALMEREFAVIVLDVQMPDMGGIELARLIKQRRRTQHIPIIFLTAHYLEDEHAALGYSVGAVDYLTKPFNPAMLRSKVNVFVDLFRKTRALEERNAALQREAEERTLRIRAEAARAEAEAANIAKDRFLAMLSHELRTPLTPIVYSVSVLERDENCPPHIREAAAMIRRNVRLEVRLIDDLLDLARIRSGKLALQVQQTDCHEILRDAIETCAADAARKGVRFVERLEASATRMQGDPARLRQIFWNLLANAVKFTPAGGTVTLLTSNPARGSLLISVEDTGIGIEAEKLGRIFDAFEQGSRNPSSGLGLGLAICKALVELHGGVIDARSEGANSGATFAVTLPCLAAAPTTEPPKAEEPERISSLRLLLVEDHPDTAEILRLLLASRGYDVRTAASVEEATQVATEFEFDMLISDIGLPDGRGTDLLTRLQTQLDRTIPAIAMSGFGMQDDLLRSRSAGFAEHLTKPIELATLQRAITRIAAMAPGIPAAR